MTVMNHDTTGVDHIASVPALCRREVWRFASWIGDLAIMAVIATVAWIFVAERFMSPGLADSFGQIAAAAVGLCIGAGLPLLVRIFRAWQFVRRLEAGRSGQPGAELRSRFLASAIQQAGASAMRCGPDDLRRAVAVAASAAADSARTAAMPATLAAFVAPAMALVGSLDMARRTPQSEPIVAMAPAMMAGIVSGLVVMLLVEALPLILSNGIQHWGSNETAADVARLSGRPVTNDVRPSGSQDRGVPISQGTTITVTAEDYEQTLKNLTRSG